MLNLWDRIEIAAAVTRGNIEYRREMNRGNRAAGSTINAKEFINSLKNRNTTKSDTVTSKSAEPVAEEKKGEVNTQNKTNSEKKTKKQEEQQRKAEAQAPVEEAGAEKIVEKKHKGVTVDGTAEAAMNAKIPHIKEPNPNVIDMSAFGVVIDQDKMAGTPNVNNHPFMANPWTQPTMNQQQWAMQQQAAMAAQQQSQAVNPNSQATDSYMGYLNQTGIGNHKVDKPKQPQKPKPEKAKPDKVEVDLPNIKMEVEPVHEKKIPEAISNPIPQAEPVKEVKVAKFDNSAMIAKYDYLKDVENIATECNIGILFMERADMMISCIIYTGNIPARDKGFVIDPGNIIDRRKKIIPGIFNFYNGQQAYPLFITNSKDKEVGKKSQNVINSDLIKGLIIGGNEFPNERDGLYREDYRKLNNFIALITIPTKDINNNERKAIQNRLVDLYKNNFFNMVYATNSRFRIESYDKKNGEFIITNIGVPPFYGAPVDTSVTSLRFNVKMNEKTVIPIPCN